MENKYIFIPKNVPSSKNSKQLFKNSRTGRTFITESEACKKYRKATKVIWQLHKRNFLKLIEGKKKPYFIEFTFVRETKAKWDFHNMVQLPLDLMQEYGWIEDDDIHNAIPVPPRGS